MTSRTTSLIGLALSLGGPLSYFLLLNHRPIGALHLFITILGMAMCVWGITKGRNWITISSLCLGLLVGLFYTVSLTVLMRLPPTPEVAHKMDTVPDFTLTNQEGRPIRPSAYKGKGPVLLVFYRGHW